MHGAHQLGCDERGKKLIIQLDDGIYKKSKCKATMSEKKYRKMCDM